MGKDLNMKLFREGLISLTSHRGNGPSYNVNVNMGEAGGSGGLMTITFSLSLNGRPHWVKVLTI